MRCCVRYRECRQQIRRQTPECAAGRSDQNPIEMRTAGVRQEGRGTTARHLVAWLAVWLSSDQPHEARAMSQSEYRWLLASPFVLGDALPAVVHRTYARRPAAFFRDPQSPSASRYSQSDAGCPPTTNVRLRDATFRSPLPAIRQ